MILHLAKFHAYVHGLQPPHESACGIVDYYGHWIARYYDRGIADCYGRGNGYAILGIPCLMIEVECDDRRTYCVEAEHNSRQDEFIRI